MSHANLNGARLKMKREHYNLLLERFRPVTADISKALDKYRDAGASRQRFRWDVLHASGLRAGQAHNDSEWPVYDYLDDTHIDNALRHVMRELGLFWAAEK